MRRADLMLVAPLLGIAAWIGVQALDVRDGVAFHEGAASGDAVRAGSTPDAAAPAPAETPRSATDDGTATEAGAEGPHVHRARTANAIADGDMRSPTRPREPAPLRDIADIHRRLDESGAGTYIGEVLADRDSALARWPDRVARPLTIWVQSADSLHDWNPAFIPQVRDAFQTWGSTDIPVGFVFVRDSAAAEVHVTWCDHFEEQISGKTMWARDENWWIVEANIVIALHHNHGETLDPSAIRAIALHEVGHLLGLDHTADTTNIMTPRVRVRDLSAADRATMKLLYTLPPGSLR
jgi:hypothetical protein